MLDFLSKLFDTSDFPPRWECGTWTAGHGWLNIASDLGVWSAYVAILCVLGYFVLRRKDIPFRTLFLLFGAFILACGTTHLMEALIFWWPAYRLAGVIKLFTAVVSWTTVIALVPVVPKVLAMRSSEEQERERQQLPQREQAVRSQAEAAKERLAFLAEASAVLSSSLDYAATLDTVARLTIARLADWCSIELVVGDGPSLQRVAVVHKDASKVELANELRRRYPPDPSTGSGVFKVLRTGRPELVPEVSDVMLEAAARDAEHLRILRGLGLKSVMIVPLVAREATLGVLSFASEQAGRRFNEDDLVLAEDLARRCAAAIDNSRLYWQAQEKIQQHREMEEQFRITLSSIGDATIATDTTGRVTFMNPVAAALTGWTPEEAQGESLETVFHIIQEQTRQSAENPVTRVLREGRVAGLANHTVLIARDGTERPIADSAAPIRHQNGDVAGVVLVFREVTEQRRAEEAGRSIEKSSNWFTRSGKLGIGNGTP